MWESKPSLKIKTANAICWNCLGLFRDYHLNYNFLGIKLFCFQDRQLKLLASVWKMILWNLTKFQLNQTSDTKHGNEICLNELNELKFCEVSQNSISNRCWQFQLSILKKQKSVIPSVAFKYVKRVPIDGALLSQFSG